MPGLRSVARSIPPFDDPPRVARATPRVVLGGWGLGVVAFTFAEAIYRLGDRAVETVLAGLTPWQWLGFAVCTALFAYGEGYRALHKRFVPKLIARTDELMARESPGVWIWLIAPLFVLHLVHAERAELARAWLALVLIVLAVLVVRELPEPYRGMIDGAVATALTIGLGSMLLAVRRRVAA